MATTSNNAVTSGASTGMRLSIKRESDKTGWRGMALVNESGYVIANMVMQLDDSEREKAALICRAVNAHSELVAALESAFDALINGQPIMSHYKEPLIRHERAIARARAALAKAQS